MAAVSFRPPPAVEAGWLVCRRWQRADARTLLEAVSTSSEHLRPWMPWSAGYNLAAAREFVARSALGEADGEVSDVGYAICDRAGHLLGGCGLHGRVGAGALEIGYWVDVRHTRRGVATLAAALLSEAGLALPSVERVEIHHDQANVASGGVPAKLGFRHVATAPDVAEAPGETGVEWQWRMERGEFPASPAAALIERSRGGGPG